MNASGHGRILRKVAESFRPRRPYLVKDADHLDRIREREAAAGQPRTFAALTRTADALEHAETLASLALSQRTRCVFNDPKLREAATAFRDALARNPTTKDTTGEGAG